MKVKGVARTAIALAEDVPNEFLELGLIIILELVRATS